MKSFNVDRGLLLIILFLVGLGLVQVYSSSFIYAIEFYSNGLYFFKKQFIFALISISALVTLVLIPSAQQKKIGVGLWFLAVLGLVFTFVPQLSIKAGGAQRWVKLPFGQRFEPSELLKVTYPFVFAYWVQFIKESEKKAYWKLLLSGLMLVPFLLLLRQPDFGSFVILSIVLFSILFVFGLKWRFIMMAVMAVVPAFYYLIVQVPYRWARVEVFLDPWKDPMGKGFQMIQSMLSFHSGGLTGVGLGESQGKLFFLPEAHTDFTLSIFSEEWGFWGFLFVILLYGYIILRSIQISIQSKDNINRAISLGLGVAFASTVFINMGVAMGVLPTKGLTLPFLSYGGSSLLSLCFAMGVLLSIDRDSKKTISVNKKKYKLI